ncbi:MAG: hypothetical protein M5R40_24340 [Anaerolineae bacterium]|nr:hypothetical protein [Anaerolineae bacterium]
MLGDGALSLLARPDDPRDEDGEAQPYRLHVRAYGGDDTLPRRLVEHVAAWDAAGRPTSSGLQVRAYPRGVDYAPSAGEAIVEKRWTQLVFSWP